MTDGDTLLLDIEAARARHAWAKAQLGKLSDSTPFTKYVEESGDDLRALLALVKPRRPVKPIAN
jgi:hypothetical protein